ncbi:multicopper oxidase [Myriangium duriaei CBS 260.36]|uniref:Multicopper oxidase n=1 Tax=Myriangium duriaei CBS 260.36 TaxID=1168546 RepID=A0A9P4IXX1_9PEZI|nr:multicopper oxidase [Myriangium duriaei CBS 260.36]
MPWKLSKHPHKASTNHTWVRSSEDYVLSNDWDYDAEPQLREYHWNVSDAEINPDGVYRQMLVINGQFPGPLLRVNDGDTIKVVVHNSAVNATSIHWHGLYQNGTNHMDGTVGVTQCPIAPGQSFTYEFKVERQSGTYWYHGHHGAQAVDGLYGPLVIHGKNEKQLQKLDYISDRIVMVSDYYHDLSGALLYPYLAPDSENSEPVPDGALINGRGSRDCSSVPHRKCDNSTRGVDNSFFSLAPNAHHRLRIINVGAFAEFQFQIDEHEMAITEVDGTDVWPKSYHRLNINPAQRYSVVIHTNVSTSSSFWMRARMITTCFAERNPHLVSDIDAIVSYESSGTTKSPVKTPVSKDWQEALWLECRDLNTTELVPVQAVPAPSTADAFFYIRSNFEIGNYRLSRGFFNASSWRPNHSSPTLTRTIAGLKAHNETFLPSSPATINDAAFVQKNEFVIQTTGIQTIDLLIHNFDDGNHPMHLHGYKYFVLAAGHGAPPRLDPLRGPADRANLQPLYDGLDLSNPLRRDTASVEAYGWLLVRFVADNPGVWAFHCHVAWHTEAGLLMQFLTRGEGLGALEVGSEHEGLCKAKGIEKGAGPRDEDYWAVAR